MSFRATFSASFLEVRGVVAVAVSVPENFQGYACVMNAHTARWNVVIGCLVGQMLLKMTDRLGCGL